MYGRVWSGYILCVCGGGGGGGSSNRVTTNIMTSPTIFFFFFFFFVESCPYLLCVHTLGCLRAFVYFFAVEDLERNDGSPSKPYYMSSGLKKVLSVKNDATDQGEASDKN